jgi:hypothetical protein
MSQGRQTQLGIRHSKLLNGPNNILRLTKNNKCKGEFNTEEKKNLFGNYFVFLVREYCLVHKVQMRYM